MATDPLYVALHTIPRQRERVGNSLPYDDPTGDMGAALADRRAVFDTSGVEALAGIVRSIRARGRARHPRITNDDAAQILIACATLTPAQLTQVSAYIPEERAA